MTRLHEERREAWPDVVGSKSPIMAPSSASVASTDSESHKQGTGHSRAQECLCGLTVSRTQSGTVCDVSVRRRQQLRENRLSRHRIGERDGGCGCGKCDAGDGSDREGGAGCAGRALAYNLLEYIRGGETVRFLLPLVPHCIYTTDA